MARHPRPLPHLTVALATALGVPLAAGTLAASPADAASTVSVACTAPRACAVSHRPYTGLPRGYDTELTCSTQRTLTAGVRIYLANGNYATATKTVSCAPGTTYSWHTDFSVSQSSVAAFRSVITAPTTVTGGAVGTAVPEGSPVAITYGFHWN